MAVQTVNHEKTFKAFMIFDPQSCFHLAADVFYSVAFGLTTLILVSYTIFGRNKRVCLYATLFSAIQTSSSVLRAVSSRNPQNLRVLIACFALQAFGPLIAIRTLYRLFVFWCRLVSNRWPVPSMLLSVSNRRADRLFSILLAALIVLCGYGVSQQFDFHDDSTGAMILRVASCIILLVVVSFELMLLATMVWLYSSSKQKHDATDNRTLGRGYLSPRSEHKKQFSADRLTNSLLLRLIGYMMLLTLFIIIAEAHNVTSAFESSFFCNKFAIYAFKALPDLLFSLGAVFPYMLASFDEEIYVETSEVIPV